MIKPQIKIIATEALGAESRRRTIRPEYRAKLEAELRERQGSLPDTGTENLKLAALRRLDKSRAWNSLDDQLYCTVCKNVISGHQIEVVGGTNGLRALHLKCSTPGCLSTPADWILPVKSDTVRKVDYVIRRFNASSAA